MGYRGARRKCGNLPRPPERRGGRAAATGWKSGSPGRMFPVAKNSGHSKVPRAVPLLVLLIVAVVALAVLPQLYVTRVIRRHSVERPDFPGTGGELAQHLLDGMKLDHVLVVVALGEDVATPRGQVAEQEPTVGPRRRATVR